MKKELKNFIYIFVIFIFLFFTLRFYFSNENIKNSYRLINFYDERLIDYTKNLKILKSDTKNIIEYVENTFGQDKNKYKFWELISND